MKSHKIALGSLLISFSMPLFPMLRSCKKAPSAHVKILKTGTRPLITDSHGGCAFRYSKFCSRHCFRADYLYKCSLKTIESNIKKHEDKHETLIDSLKWESNRHTKHLLALNAIKLEKELELRNQLGITLAQDTLKS